MRRLERVLDFVAGGIGGRPSAPADDVLQVRCPFSQSRTQVLAAIRDTEATDARSAVFEDWLPDGSILIATRFGDTAVLPFFGLPRTIPADPSA